MGADSSESEEELPPIFETTSRCCSSPTNSRGASRSPVKEAILDRATMIDSFQRTGEIHRYAEFYRTIGQEVYDCQRKPAPDSSASLRSTTRKPSNTAAPGLEGLVEEHLDRQSETSAFSGNPAGSQLTTRER